jgi:hypothetical protein
MTGRSGFAVEDVGKRAAQYARRIERLGSGAVFKRAELIT